MTRRQVRQYGTASLGALAASAQDDTLKHHFLHLIRGADEQHGPLAAEELGAYIDRAMAQTGWSFAGLMARLLQVYAQENCR